MRVTVLLAALAFAGCDLEPQPASPGVLRQGVINLSAAPTVVGKQAFSRLGSSLASCRNGGFVAGAPGSNEVYLSPSGTFFTGPTTGTNPNVGEVVACKQEANPYPLAGGRPGYYSFYSGGAVQRLAGTTEAIALPSANTAAPALVIADSKLFSDTGTTPRWTTLTGNAVTWFAQGALFAVGTPEQNRVELFKWEQDGGVTALPGGQISLTTGAATGFGAVLASGDVHPRPGPELIVGAPALDRVYIYSGTTLVSVLSPEDNLLSEFGAALAVEQRDAGGGLSALWVGDPQRGRAHRYLGTARESVGSPGSAGQRFGASLAADPSGLMAIGAPLYNDAQNNRPNAGAVFIAEALEASIDAVAQSCMLGVPCQLGACQVGTCLGEVLCVRPAAPRGCPVGDTCDPNTGQCVSPGRDAGARSDGGEPEDAGAPDAGDDDAGRPGGDAGNGPWPAAEFRACSAGSGGPALLLLALTWLRRRRSA